jgi:hypothetical protein
VLVVYGRDEATKVAEDSLIRQSLSLSSDNKTLPLNIVDALLLAAIDEGIHLDSVSFFYYGDNLMSNKNYHYERRRRRWQRNRTTTTMMTMIIMIMIMGGTMETTASW